jgi:hypothetical protein
MWWYMRMGTRLTRSTPSGVGKGVGVGVGVEVGVEVAVGVGLGVRVGVGVRVGRGVRVGVGVRVGDGVVLGEGVAVGVSARGVAVQVLSGEGLGSPAGEAMPGALSGAACWEQALHARATPTRKSHAKRRNFRARPASLLMDKGRSSEEDHERHG